MQHDEHKSIFACDEAAVYSSSRIDIGGFFTNVVRTDLHCQFGGRFHTALNTAIFNTLWDQVVQDGRFRFHDWTVKVDPDAVFFPQRLLELLWHPKYDRAQQNQGAFFNNCNQSSWSMHGPIEVFSRRALEVFVRGKGGCPWHNQEDWFVSNCMYTLGVTSHDVHHLLADKACPGQQWAACTTGMVAFHPFKSLHEYQRCWKEANHHHPVQAWVKKK